MLKDPEIHAQFKARALEQSKRYALDNILPMYEAFYEEVIAKKVHMV